MNGVRWVAMRAQFVLVNLMYSGHNCRKASAKVLTNELLKCLLDS